MSMRALQGLVLAPALLLAAACGNSAPEAAHGDKKLTIVVLVVDSLMPDEIGPNTPNLMALRDAGTSYAESRAVYAAETIPNHVAMMTGVYPQRNGIATNDFIDDVSTATKVRLSIPERLTANTLFTWIGSRCGGAVRTGATLSKKYLFDVFSGDAKNAARANDNPRVFNVPPQTFWDPTKDSAYIGSPDEHTPDAPTMTDARSRIDDADFFFINLGDVDRIAHASGESARQVALPDTDAQVGNLVSDLQASGRWDNTVMFVVSDHGMDYSPGPATAITTQAMLDQLAGCYLPMKSAASGQGTDGIYVLDRNAPKAQRQAALRAARSCLLGNGCECGATRPTNASFIAGAWYREDDPLDPAGSMPASIATRHPNIGDLTVFAAAMGKFYDSQAESVLSGNHGHPLTLHNTFIVTGGSPWVKKGQVIAASSPNPGPLDRLPEQSENVDIAPTVNWLLGMKILPGDFPDYPQWSNGFDGRVLKEAFTQFDGNAAAPPPTTCGQFE